LSRAPRELSPAVLFWVGLHGMRACSIRTCSQVLRKSPVPMRRRCPGYQATGTLILLAHEAVAAGGPDAAEPLRFQTLPKAFLPTSIYGASAVARRRAATSSHSDGHARFRHAPHQVGGRHWRLPPDPMPAPGGVQPAAQRCVG